MRSSKLKISRIPRIDSPRPKDHFNERIRSKKSYKEKLEAETFKKKKKKKKARFSSEKMSIFGLFKIVGRLQLHRPESHFLMRIEDTTNQPPVRYRVTVKLLRDSLRTLLDGF